MANYKTRAPNGPNIAHLGMFYKLIIEILSFSCSVLFLVMTDGDNLAMLNCKISKWLNAKIMGRESGYKSIERFFKFPTSLFLVTDAILTDLFLFDFKTI